MFRIGKEVFLRGRRQNGVWERREKVPKKQGCALREGIRVTCQQHKSLKAAALMQRMYYHLVYIHSTESLWTWHLKPSVVHLCRVTCCDAEVKIVSTSFQYGSSDLKLYISHLAVFIPWKWTNATREPIVKHLPAHHRAASTPLHWNGPYGPNLTSLSLNPTWIVWFLFFSSSPECLMSDHFLPLAPPLLPSCWDPLLTLLLFLSTFTQALQDSLLLQGPEMLVFPTALALILSIHPLKHSWVASSSKTTWHAHF